MIGIELGDVAAVTGGRLLPGTNPDFRVSGPVVIDSRLVGDAGLFACLPGEHTDGHRFAAAAAEAGSAVLASRSVAAPGVQVPDVAAALAALAGHTLARSRATTVGVTGSSGKTSTKDLLATVFAADAPTVAPPGSFNNELGLPLTLCQLTARTRWLICEYSARGPGHIAELCRIAPPSYAGVLNVGQAHVGEFGSVDAIAVAKGELVEAVPADGVVVLNFDDPRVAAMSERASAPVLGFGQTRRADVRVTDVRLDDIGRPAFALATPVGSAQLQLQLVGTHHVMNAAAAAGLAVAAGLPFELIVDALQQARPVSRHRMEVHRRSDGVTVVDDAYNANPESMSAGLRATASLAEARPAGGSLWAVLGTMHELGDQSDALHAAVGAEAAALGYDRVVAVGPGARAIAAAAGRDSRPAGRFETVADVEAAVALLEAELSSGDVVLVKGSNAERLWLLAERLHDRADVPASAVRS